MAWCEFSVADEIAILVARPVKHHQLGRVAWFEYDYDLYLDHRSVTTNRVLDLAELAAQCRSHSAALVIGAYIVAAAAWGRWSNRG